MIIDLSGKRFNRLTAVKRIGQNKHLQSIWEFKCDCGNYTSIVGSNAVNGNTKSCGCLRVESIRKKRQDNPQWKGGRINTGGYISLLRPDHPNCESRGYVREHRLIMEENIGRLLSEDETVHHINGVKTDNRIENLELWSTRHPKGQRVEDKIVHAIEILKIHRPELLSNL